MLRIAKDYIELQGIVKDRDRITMVFYAFHGLKIITWQKWGIGERVFSLGLLRIVKSGMVLLRITWNYKILLRI